MYNLLDLSRLEIWTKTGALELTYGDKRIRFDAIQFTEMQRPAAVLYVEKNVDISAIIDEKKRKMFGDNVEVSDEILSAAGLTVNKVRDQEIQNAAERIAREKSEALVVSLVTLMENYLNGGE